MSVLDTYKLEGKTALVTGCRRGIGKSIALALAEAGADIVGVSLQLESKESQVETEVRALGKNFTGYTCDFLNRDDLYTFINKVKSDFSQIDILVNNAGIQRRKPAEDFPDDYWDSVVEVNLTAQFILSREFGKEMIARGTGNIIFMASLLTFQGGITVPAYAASKGGVKQLMLALSNEWAGKGVNVNAIAPGYINTEMNEALMKDPVRRKQIMERIPAGRWGKPDDFKGAVVFLASRASEYIHGNVLLVDGGWMGR